MGESPPRGVARGARLGALPVNFAGRAAAGWVRRVSGADRSEIAAEVALRNADQLFAVLAELKGGAMKLGQLLAVYEASGWLGILAQLDCTFEARGILTRWVRRVEPDLLTDVPPVIAHVARYEIDETVRAIAASYPDPNLRSLDTIHLATAKGVFGHRLTAFISYDQRLLASAAAAGPPTASPGAPTDRLRP